MTEPSTYWDKLGNYAHLDANDFMTCFICWKSTFCRIFFVVYFNVIFRIKEKLHVKIPRLTKILSIQHKYMTFSDGFN